MICQFSAVILPSFLTIGNDVQNGAVQLNPLDLVAQDSLSLLYHLSGDSPDARNLTQFWKTNRDQVRFTATFRPPHPASLECFTRVFSHSSHCLADRNHQIVLSCQTLSDIGLSKECAPTLLTDMFEPHLDKVWAGCNNAWHPEVLGEQ